MTSNLSDWVDITTAEDAAHIRMRLMSMETQEEQVVEPCSYVLQSAMPRLDGYGLWPMMDVGCDISECPFNDRAFRCSRILV